MQKACEQFADRILENDLCGSNLQLTFGSSPSVGADLVDTCDHYDRAALNTLMSNARVDGDSSQIDRSACARLARASACGETGFIDTNLPKSLQARGTESAPLKGASVEDRRRACVCGVMALCLQAGNSLQ